MPTLPPHVRMIADRAGRRRVQRLRWHIALHKVLSLPGFFASYSACSPWLSVTACATA